MHKVLLILLNLSPFTLIIDLVSKEIVEKWIKYLRNEFPTVAFKASTQQQAKNLVNSEKNYILGTF